MGLLLEAPHLDRTVVKDLRTIFWMVVLGILVYCVPTLGIKMLVLEGQLWIWFVELDPQGDLFFMTILYWPVVLIITVLYLWFKLLTKIERDWSQPIPGWLVLVLWLPVIAPLLVLVLLGIGIVIACRKISLARK